MVPRGGAVAALAFDVGDGGSRNTNASIAACSGFVYFTGGVYFGTAAAGTQLAVGGLIVAPAGGTGLNARGIAAGGTANGCFFPLFPLGVFSATSFPSFPALRRSQSRTIGGIVDACDEVGEHSGELIGEVSGEFNGILIDSGRGRDAVHCGDLHDEGTWSLQPPLLPHSLGEDSGALLFSLLRR